MTPTGSFLATVLTCGFVAFPSTVLAQGSPRDLSQVSIEDLMKIEVTGPNRKEQPISDVAAAVFVITNEDIRRSGMTSITDLLRLAPGVDVAQINSNKWAVSVRGYNGLYANKLLVLVDGRSVYNRLFSGVIWDTQDLMLDDIDRIEVIRGPGAAMWGANAVNGVINIVTKSAAETQGTLVRVDGGNMAEQAAVRYGGTLKAARYRLFAQMTGRNQSQTLAGTPANDASHSITTGVRADWTNRADAYFMASSFTTGQARALWPNYDVQTAAREPILHDPSDGTSGSVLGRWTHTRTGGATLQVQSFMAFVGRQEPIGDYNRRVMDLDTQYHTAIGAHQDVVVGAGYRRIREGLEGRGGFSLNPTDNHSVLWSGFLQDEIALLGNRLAVTVGAQLQHDSDSGAGVQPTARAIWKGLPRQRLWAAVSRALRTPSLSDRMLRLEYLPIPGPGGLPVFVTVVGNPAAESETFVDAETGYRLEVGTFASIDVTGFVGHYDQLVTWEAGPPSVQFVPSPRILVTTQFGNQLQATTRGVEVSGRWAPAHTWHVDGSLTAFHVTPKLAASSTDPLAATDHGSTPRMQWQLGSAWSPASRATITGAIFHVGRIEQLQVDAYTRTDITAEWRFTSSLSAMAIGQNLFDAAHAEFGSANVLLSATQVPRSASVRLRWTLP